MKHYVIFRAPTPSGFYFGCCGAFSKKAQADRHAEASPPGRSYTVIKAKDQASARKEVESRLFQDSLRSFRS